MFSLKVDGICCEGCVRDIRKEVKKMEGVDSVVVDAAEETVVVTGTVHPDKVISMLHKKLKKKAEVLRNDTPPPPNCGPDSQMVVVAAEPPNNAAAMNLLSDPDMAARALEYGRNTPGVTSVVFSSQTVTRSVTYNF